MTSTAVARRPAARATVQAVVAILGGAVALWWALPRVTGQGWASIAVALHGVTLLQLAGLTLLWAAGLLVYSFVLTGALPGLSRRRALTLNLTGSAVSNVAPLGGAIGVATNLAMVRAWRFRPTTFATYAVVTNIWDVLGKMALPLVALTTLLAAGQVATPVLQIVAIAGSGALLSLLVLAAVLVRSERAASAVASAITQAAKRVLPARFAARLQGLESAVASTRTGVAGVIAGAWPQLTMGMVGYLGLQFTLLWACLHVVGGVLPVAVVFAAFAVERLLTLAVLTPGGTGIAEAGTAGVLLAFGGDPLSVAAGVLLYRGFTFLLEIPVGGLWLGAWAALRLRRTRAMA